jgi:Cupin domain
MAHFPKQLHELPKFDGPFDAHKLSAKGCDVLFASYPANTLIPAHTHATDNIGVITQGELILTVGGVEQRYGVGSWYQVAANVAHAAKFEVPTSEIEFWFIESCINDDKMKTQSLTPNPSPVSTVEGSFLS